MRLSARVQRIAPSITLAVSARAAKLQQQGRDIISFGVGEPDFATPAHIQAAATVAMESGATKYTAVAGISELRAAVAAELSQVHDMPLFAENVLVSTGAKHSLYNLLMALLDDGDEVIVPTPCWPSHVELVRMAGGVAVLAEQRSEDGFRLDPALLARKLNKRTRAIILNSPTNPTGAVYDAANLAAIAQVIRTHGGPELLIITDDLYRRLVYAPAIWASLCRVAPDLRDRTLLIDGVSKTYAMTGWRIGFCAGPKQLVDAMAALQSQTTTNATAIAQFAAVAALTGDQAPTEAMRLEFDHRRQIMYRALGQIPGVRCAEPQGAFYSFPDMRAYLRPAGKTAVEGQPTDDVQLCDWLLQHAGIATVPGSGFFAPGFLRLSYATSLASIEEGMRRLATGLSKLGLP
jgi:aspartate aminotransferase